VRPTATAILKTVERLGYLQLDPTNVVARNHLLVLWSRLGRYDPADLDRLLWKEKALYENLPSIALILPTSDRSLHEVRTRVMRRGQAWPRLVRMHAWMKKNARLRRDVMTRLRRHGALPLSAFEGRAIDSWHSSDSDSELNVSRMLNSLLRLGEVAIGGRAGGKKMWTLAQGWLPSVRPMTPKAAARAATERALGIRIEGFRDQYFALTSQLRKRHAAPERTTLLSPFDNLIINRTRTEVLFGMRYRMEIYMPKHLRVRGFWAMPIVHNAQLIGTVDPKVDRERGRLEVQGLHLERDAPRDRSTRRAIEAAVEDLARFVGATEVTWPKRIASSYSRR
jgi:uncharacterized protein YcaQ